MEEKAIDKIHLCINELQMMKRLMEQEAADDFVSRIFAIYVTVRVDDITKMWSHSIPKNKMERFFTDEVKAAYNKDFRMIRDKLGAHYQSTSEKVDLLGGLKLFKTLNYANTACLVDDICKVEELIEGHKLDLGGFEKGKDLCAAKDVLASLYSDDIPMLTTGALDLFGQNKGGLMTFSEGQIKAQYLKSIEVMVDVAYRLMNATYISKDASRMFKRLFVCLVYNYHDNFVTRKDIPVHAEQYEKGFDLLFLDLISGKDDRKMLEHAFDEFENIYRTGDVMGKCRTIRDHAAAHLDEKSTACEINAELDAVDMGKLYAAFSAMQNFFSFICNHVRLLQPLSLPARTKLFDGQIVALDGNENFYGRQLDAEPPSKMSCAEMLRSVRKKDDRYEEACKGISDKLFAQSDATYREMIEAIEQRMATPSLGEEELSDLVKLLDKACNGYPDRLQKSVLQMLSDENIRKSCGYALLWLLAKICRKDDRIDVPKLLDAIIKQGQWVSKAFAILGFLHLIVEDTRSCIVAQNKAHSVDSQFDSYCQSFSNATEECAVMIMLSQHWFFGSNYAAVRSYESLYADYLCENTWKTLENYFVYANIEENEKKVCRRYLEQKRYLLLLCRLAALENNRNQKINLFMELWKHNCFIRYKADVYEALAVGVLTEMAGDTDAAKLVFDSLLKEYPIHRDVINNRNEFYIRHPEMDGK